METIPTMNANDLRSTILIVDSDRAQAELVRHAIKGTRSYNLDAVCETDALQAIWRVNNPEMKHGLRPAGVIIEHQLRGPVNGLQLAACLRSISISIPILFLCEEFHPQAFMSPYPLGRTAWGFVLKREGSAMLVNALLAVMGPVLFVSPHTQRNLAITNAA